MAPLGGHRSLTAENVTARSPGTAAARGRFWQYLQEEAAFEAIA
jgi:hypothetical protein